MNFFSLIHQKKNVKLIVLGHQKSGTTAIGSLLSMMSNLSYSNDPFYEIDKGKGGYVNDFLNHNHDLNKIIAKSKKGFIQNIIKEPDFIYRFDHLFKVYKNAKYLFVVRNPIDTIRSICNRLGLVPSQKISSTSTDEMVRGNRHWLRLLSGKLPELIRGYSNDSYVFNIALRWSFAANIYLANSHRITLVRYEDFQQNKEEVLRTILRDFDLPVVNDVKDHLNKQFQPKGQKNVCLDDFFGLNNISLIHEICGREMRLFDYPL